MAKQSKTKGTNWFRFVSIWICLFGLILSLSMMIPLWVALAAGISGISIVLFSFTGFIAISLLFIDKSPLVRVFAATTVIVSLFSVVVPLVAFFNVAKLTGTKLTFDPVSYLTFSGSTEIKPTSVNTYKSIATEKLEIAYYKANKEGITPVVVLLHGGAWRYGSHMETGQWPKVLTDAGYAVVSVQYRLSNDTYHSWEDTPADVHDAITYLRDNAELYSIDPEQIHLMGQSAGGHLALLEAYRSESVKSVIALYAPIDLTLDYETSSDKSAELDYIGGPPEQYPQRYESSSPIAYVTHRTPPTLVIQGLYDDLVHQSQASRLAEVLDVADVQNYLVLLPLTGHSFENQRGGFATQIATQRVLQFLK